MGILLLEDAVDLLVSAQGDRDKLAKVLYLVLGERVGVMHARAQAAEGRAHKAEARLAKLSRVVGNIPEPRQ